MYGWGCSLSTGGFGGCLLIYEKCWCGVASPIRDVRERKSYLCLRWFMEIFEAFFSSSSMKCRSLAIRISISPVASALLNLSI